MDTASLIAWQCERLSADFQLYPVTASEIEFYLPGSESSGMMAEIWAEIAAACTDAGILLFKMEKEKGLDQYEIALSPAAPLATAQATHALKTIITSAAAHYGIAATFAAKPFADRPGSGLHIHVHLENASGKNVFIKDDISISDPLQFSLGGLLAWLADSMAVFAPNPESYARFMAGTNAPLTVSWGANNRTVALRLPDSAHDAKRIEHRVAGADADAGRVMALILAGMHYGLAQRIVPSAQIYGDAALTQYNLPRLPVSLDEARSMVNPTGPVSHYFSAGQWP
jgi:glutamine synthetase